MQSHPVTTRGSSQPCVSKLCIERLDQAWIRGSRPIVIGSRPTVKGSRQPPSPTAFPAHASQRRPSRRMLQLVCRLANRLLRPTPPGARVLRAPKHPPFPLNALSAMSVPLKQLPRWRLQRRRRLQRKLQLPGLLTLPSWLSWGSTTLTLQGALAASTQATAHRLMRTACHALAAATARLVSPHAPVWSASNEGSFPDARTTTRALSLRRRHAQ